MKTVKITILCLLLFILIFFSFMLFPSTNAISQSTNDISILFATIQNYNAYGTSFTDSEVNGTESWSSNFANTIDSTNEVVNGLSVSLDSSKTFDGLSPKPDLYGPPTYHWSFGDITQNPLPDWSPQAVVGLKASTSPVTFKPGFDVSWSADKTIFSSPGIQTITLTLIPKETQNYNIAFKARQTSFVKATINPPIPDESGNIDLAADGSSLTIYKHQQPAGAVLKYTIAIQVTPNNQTVEFLPDISVSSSQDLWGENVSGSSFSRTIANVGTWTWTAQGDYNCSLHEIYSRVVGFKGYSQAVSEENHARLGFGSHFDFHSPTNNFTNKEVDGQISWWFSSFTNLSTVAEANNVNLSLTSDKLFARLNPRPTTYGPPTYFWSFGDIPEYTGAGWIPQTGPSVGLTDAPIKFTPGFDASCAVNKTNFTTSGTQVLKVTVIPREKKTIDIQIEARGNNLASVIIKSPVTDEANGIINNSGFLWIHKEDLVVGKAYTFTVNIQVIPNFPEVGYMPTVTVSTSINEAQGTIIGNSLSRTIPDFGTWTWTAEGTYLMDWYQVTSRRIFFDGFINANPLPIQNTTDFTESVPLPSEVSTDPEVIGTNVFLTSFLIAIFYFATILFNSTFKENYETIRNWDQRLRRRFRILQTIRGKPTKATRKGLVYLEVALIVVATAIINSIVDPGFGLSIYGLIVFIAMMVASVASTYGYDGIQALITRHTFHIPATVEVYPLAIPLAVVFVFLSRMVHFSPGLIFGFVGAFTVLSSTTTPNKRQRSIGIILGVIVITIIASIAFFIRQMLVTVGEGFWISVADTILVATFVVGLEGLIFGLLPLTFLDGGTLASWKKWVWVIVFAVVSFVFYHIIVNKMKMLTDAVTDINVIVLLIITICCVIFSIGFWLYFRLRRTKVSN